MTCDAKMTTISLSISMASESCGSESVDVVACHDTDGIRLSWTKSAVPSMILKDLDVGWFHFEHFERLCVGEKFMCMCVLVINLT